MPDPAKNNEVDLLDLILTGVSTLRTNFWLIVTFFVLGSALGLAYFFSVKKVYESKMIISSGILTASYTTILFDNANVHLSEGNFKAFAALFHIDEKTAHEVNAIRIANISKTVTTEITESDRYLITVEVFDQTVLPELQKGIIDYLENNEFVKIRVEQNRSTAKQMLANVDNEIKDMEEFKGKIYNGNFLESVKGNLMFDPTTVNSKILELKEKKISYENSLQLSSSVQVIEGFTQFKRHLRPRLSVSVTAGSSVGLIFVALLIAFKSIRKLLALAEANKTKNAA